MSIKIDLNLILIFITALSFGLALVPTSIIIASRLKAFSPIDFRRKNRRQVPLMGGLAIYIATLITATIFSVPSALYIVLCALPIVLTGVIDDLKELGSKPKFFAQILATAILLYFREPGTLVLEQVGMAPWSATLFTGFWIIGVTNAFNLIDGMDGVAGGVAVICSLTFAVMGMWSQITPFSLMLAGSSLAFLFFNWPNAKIFLGDSGSTFLGFALAAVACMVPLPTPHFLWVTAPMFVLAFPQVDAVLAMYRRARLGLSLFKGDHDHIHHRLRKIGLSGRRSLAVIYSVGIYCSATATSLYFTQNVKFALVVLFLTTSALCAFLAGVHFVQLRLAQQVSTYSKTLIEKHFNLQENLMYDPANFSAIVFDLLPYYKELQQRGLPKVDSFISTFSRVVEKHTPDGQLLMLGSYSLGIVFSGDVSHQLTQKRLTEEFKSLIESFEILRNQKEIPEGVHFYSPTQNGRDFVVMTQNRRAHLLDEEAAA